MSTVSMKKIDDREVSARKPELVDSHVGSRIRVCRKLMGHSQQSLASSLGLTFQQVQKYERGSNRVSASKLYDIARFLGVPISYFFEELPDPAAPDGRTQITASESERRIHDFLRSPDGLELIDALSSIAQPAFRRSLIQLVRTVARQEGSTGPSMDDADQ